MATLPGQRAQSTWALNQYNLTEDSEKRTHFAKRMANYIAAAPANGFTVEEVTQGQSYPADEVNRYLRNPEPDAEPEISEGQALKEIAQAVDSSDVVRIGEGPGVVYAYGYRCAIDRLKIGGTAGDTIQRIVAQISTGTPDRPVLQLEIKTPNWPPLERAIHAILGARGHKVTGGGQEWYTTTRDEVIAIYNFITKPRLQDPP
jgi:T5orf172 domain